MREVYLFYFICQGVMLMVAIAALGWDVIHRREGHASNNNVSGD